MTADRMFLWVTILLVFFLSLFVIYKSKRVFRVK